jgi:5-deoxy-glucuronate isomerase
MSFLIKGRPHKPGLTSLAAPGRSALRYVEFSLLRLSNGESYTLTSDQRETVVYLIVGSARLTAETLRSQVTLGPRRSVFEDGPSAIYLPPGAGVGIVAGVGGVEAAVVRAPSTSRAPAALVTPAELERRSVGASNWSRSVYNVIDATRGAGRLMVGETINPPGCWSSYPPHKHDSRTPSGELPMEEVYYYLIRPEGGFGLQMLYTAPGASEPIDDVYRVEDGDLVVIPRGYHPVVAAAGYELCYLWAMAGKESRYGAWSDDPTHSWVHERERDLLRSGAPGR